MPKYDFFLVCLLACYTSLAFSQEEADKVTFVTAIKKKSETHKTQVNFYKAQSFFVKKEWDSTLFYSMKQLSTGTVIDLNDYCHYFRAVSFKKKRFLKNPEKSLG